MQSLENKLSNHNAKTHIVKSPSYLHRLVGEARRRILQLLFGSKAGNCLDEYLQEYKNLLRFNPTNILETYMKQPSDICEHLATLYMLTVEFDLENVLELGTAEGKSTIALLQAAYQIGGSVHSIDVNPCQEAREAIKKSNLLDRWSFIQGDDLQVNWDRCVDHLFIDTSHEFEHTLKELQKYEPYVRNGGIITLHDIISLPEVMDAITEYLKNRSDLRLYKYLHNNGLAIIFKGRQKSISVKNES